jgi:sugar O-acyltransferase (sialic acid O-acetyltransferase NeuD family)
MKIAVIGAGSMARIVYEIFSYDRNIEVTNFVHNVKPSGKETIKNIPIIGDHSVLPKLLEKGIRGTIIAVSMNDIRAAHYQKLKKMGFEFVNAIHPTATISPSVKMGFGIIISIGVIISTGAQIHDNVIIDTGAIIDHECEIEEGAYIGSGCSLAGKINIKKGVFVSIGSSIRETITIGENSIINPGSIVLEDIPDNVVAGGVPAKILKKL